MRLSRDKLARNSCRQNPENMQVVPDKLTENLQKKMQFVARQTYPLASVGEACTT